MGPLMPQVLADVAATTGGRFELVVVENTLFGPSVTTAGLLPGTAIERALRDRGDLDFVLLPAEAVNDDLVFVDDLSADELAARVPMPVRFSYDFVDALTKCEMRSADCGIDLPASSHDVELAHRNGHIHSAFRIPHSALGEGKGEGRG